MLPARGDGSSIAYRRDQVTLLIAHARANASSAARDTLSPASMASSLRAAIPVCLASIPSGIAFYSIHTANQQLPVAMAFATG